MEPDDFLIQRAALALAHLMSASGDDEMKDLAEIRSADALARQTSADWSSITRRPGPQSSRTGSKGRPIEARSKRRCGP
jgi:hypothetical protein